MWLHCAIIDVNYCRISLLLGRLGLDTARVPYKERSGLLYLARGSLTARDGALTFHQKTSEESDALDTGHYSIPTQNLSIILLGPGSTISHDALRLLARAGTVLAAVGEDGVRMYTAPPLIANRTTLARKQARIWANEDQKVQMARKMFEIRLGPVFGYKNIDKLRGIEGSRMKESYKILADRIGVPWKGRRYDRNHPLEADLPNQAINHAASAVEAAAAIAVSATATIPQLGFIHEDPGQSFVLDISDLYRDQITIPCAFRAAKKVLERPTDNIERVTRKMVGHQLTRENVIPAMIEQIKNLLTSTD